MNESFKTLRSFASEYRYQMKAVQIENNPFDM